MGRREEGKEGRREEGRKEGREEGKKEGREEREREREREREGESEKKEEGRGEGRKGEGAIDGGRKRDKREGGILTSSCCFCCRPRPQQSPLYPPLSVPS